MKKIWRCLVCNRAVPQSLAYQVESEVRASSFTGETVQGKIAGYICPTCNKVLGYKTSEKKRLRFEGILTAKEVTLNAKG